MNSFNNDTPGDSQKDESQTFFDQTRRKLSEASAIGVVSLNFVDLNDASGPGVNELEFNRWLMDREPTAFLITTRICPSLPSTRQIALGNVSLRRPIAFAVGQIRALLWVTKNLDRNGIVYYRHTRLGFAWAAFRVFRPDIRLISTRVNGVAAADAQISSSGLGRLAAQFIERIDWLIRRRLARSSYWVDCVTEVQARALSRSSGVPVEVVPNGVNCEVFRAPSDKERFSVRAELGIPLDAVVVGFCGGFPEQRGAREVHFLARSNPGVFGLIIGEMSPSVMSELSSENVLCLGKRPYADVPRLIGAFDVGVAFDTVGRAKAIGNSNQKLRQYLAVGVYALTSESDIDFDGAPWLGASLSGVSQQALQKGFAQSLAYISGRSARASFAREFLDVREIFNGRHSKITRRQG